jgi:methionine-rich copper-binding protein CopC
MNRPSPQTLGNMRVFVATLLSFAILMTPIAAVGASTRTRTSPSPKSEPKSPKTLEQRLFMEPMPLMPPSGSITATKSDAFPSHPSAKAEPGDQIDYTVDIGNTGGTDATSVLFTDTIDANTTLVGGSIKMSPLAFADTYSAEKDVLLSVGAPGVLTNDAGLPAPSATAITAGPTTAGGTVTLNADGSFSYTPPSGYTGPDSFNYTATNGQAPPNASDAQATVTINVDARPEVSSTTPTNNATDRAIDINITVNFTENVDVTTNSFKIECPAPGNAQAFGIGGSGTNAITLDPTAALPTGTTCTVTVVANQVSDSDTNDPPDNMSSDYVFSFTTDAAPTVTSTTPNDTATNVASGANIIVNFSENVAASTSSFSIECPAPGNLQTVAVTGTGTSQITLNPDSDLPAGMLCTVTVIATQIADSDTNDPPNNMAANYVFSFTTDAAPSVTNTTPANGASGVAANANIVIDFNENVTVSGSSFTIDCPTPGNPQTFVVTGSGTSQITLNPDSDLPGGVVCTVVVVANQVSDTDSTDPPDNMAANHVFAFTIDAAPSVTTTTPTNGATNVGASTNITINFSENVDIVDATAFTIECPVASPVAFGVTPSAPGSTNSFVLDPTSDLPFGVVCTVTVVASKVTDVDTNDPPNNMAADYVFSFTVDSPPAVTTTSPANNDINVAKTSNIIVNFNENVDVTTNSFSIECPAPGNLQPFAVTGSGTTAITLNPNADLPVGVICTVTVIANEVADSDSGDPPNLMTSNFVFSFGVKPEAGDDARDATGNVRINTDVTAYSIKTNDIGPGLNITLIEAGGINCADVSAPFTCTTLRGGQIEVDADGTFTYNPPAGYEGPDSFNYTTSNAAGFDVGTVNITVAGMIWFIDDNAAACTSINGVCGRLTNPLSGASALATFDTANGDASVTNGSDVVNPEAGDHIFLYSGSYTGPLTLENTQRLIGEGATGTLAGLSGITPAPDSDALPVLVGLVSERPSITSTTNGINLAVANRLHGLAFSNVGAATANNAIQGSAGGALIISEVGINNSGSNGGGINLTGVSNVANTVEITGTTPNTINVRSGTGLRISNNFITTNNATFKSISVGNNAADADPANAIVLSNTGTTAGTHGSLIILGDGNTSVGGNSSGGTIQSTTSHGISLTSTRGPSFTNINIQSATGSCIDGTGVVNFTLVNSTVNNCGTVGASDSSNIAFNDQALGTENNLSGVVNISSNILTNAAFHGVDIYNHAGTISDIDLSSNTITSSTSTVTSKGSGIRLVAFGSAAGVANVTKGDINTNTISNFPSGAGILAFGGNPNSGAGAPAGVYGTLNHATDIINITGNTIQGETALNKMGTHAIQASVAGRGQGNYNISNNGTLLNPITNISGNVISTSALGVANVSMTIDNNVIVANHQIDFGGPFGISTGAGQVAGIGGTASLFVVITDNNVSQTDSSGIRVTAGEATASVHAAIKNNTVGAPLGVGVANGIRIDSGTSTSTDNTVCIEISGNTTAGESGQPGIGLRKQGTVSTTHEFGIEGLAPSPATAAQTDTFVTGQNPASVGGVLIISGDNFVSCSTAPVAVNMPDNNRPDDYAQLENSIRQDGVPFSIAMVLNPWAVTETLALALIDGWNLNTTPSSTKPVFSAESREVAFITPPQPSMAMVSGSVATSPDVTSRLPKQAMRKASQILTPRSVAARTALPLKAEPKSTKPSESTRQSFSHHARPKPKASSPKNSTAMTNVSPMLSGETINITIGTLPAGKSVRITFSATIDNGFSGTQVANQGSVSGDISGNSFTNVTDDPGTGTADDTTITPVLAVANAEDDTYIAFKNTPLNVPAPGIVDNDSGSPDVTAITGCGDATAPFNCTTAQSGTIVVQTDGSFAYTPPVEYTGPDSFGYTATNATGPDTATVNITVQDTTAIYINEVLFDPPGTDAPHEYIELRGVGGATIPTGTYLVAIEGDAADNPGDVQTIINLGGLVFGPNGFLVLLQNGEGYTTDAGAQVETSTTTGFGGLPGSRWSADASATDIEDASVTFMLVQTGVAPALTDDIDSDDDGSPSGSVFAGWNVRDSISAMDGSSNARGYGAFTFRQSGGTGGTSMGGEVVVTFTPAYLGRNGDSTGAAAADWVASGVLGGAAPNWTLGVTSETEPASFAGKPLNHIGNSNFVNLSPLNSVPGAQAMLEDQTLFFTGATAMTTSDPDAGGATVQVTLTAVNGTLNLGGTTGLTFTPTGANNDGVNDAQMIFTGTIADINTALNNTNFTPVFNYFGPASVTIETNDLGNTGPGGNKTDTDTVNITVNGVNDAPSFTKGANQIVNEDDGPQTVNGWATSISEGPGESGQTLNFNVSITGTTGNIAFSSEPSIDGTTGNLTYTTSSDSNGTANISVTLSDNGSNALPNRNSSAAQTFVITVNPVNDPPTFEIPSDPPPVNEDAPAQTVNNFATNFQPGPPTATDEAGQTLVAYTVTQTGSTGSLTFASDPEIDDAGTLTYTPNENTSGTATFSAAVLDSGTGDDAALSAPVNFTITVNGENDAPVLDNTGNMTLNAINEDVPNASNPGTLVADIIASAGGDRITDVDAGALEGIAVIAANNTNGTWEFSIDNGTNWTAFGSPASVTARLLAANATTRVRFIPNANFNGTVDPGITFRAWDQTSGTNGNTADATIVGGTTAFSTATETASITVNAVNDTPTTTGIPGVVVNEDAADTVIDLRQYFDDVEDAPAGLVYTVQANTNAGLFTSTTINNANDNLSLDYAPNANGVAMITVRGTDTGSLFVDTTFQVTINGVNDAPVNTVPGAQSVIENSTLTFSAANANQISVAEVDAGSNQIQVTLTSGNGTFTLSGTSGLTFVPAGPGNDGTGDSTLTFNGTLANINAALNGLVFTPTQGFDGVTSVQILSNDLGLGGSGEEQADDDVITVTVLDGGALQFSSATYTVNEDNGTATITVNRTGGTNGEARIDYATSNGTATGGGTDYTTSNGTLTFANGVTTQTFTVPINNDLIDEPDETINLTLSNPQGSGALGSQATAVLTITDNDLPPTISISDVSVTEGDSGTVPATFAVTLSNPSTQIVTVQFTTTQDSATSNSDYLATTGTVTFNPLETSKSITVDVNGDTAAESNEVFFIDLSAPTNATLADPLGVGTILDDDAAFQLVLEEFGPDPNQALALDSILFLRDPFRVRSIAEWIEHGSDQNTRVLVFATNLSLGEGETASSVVVNLSDSNNQIYELPAEDVRPVPGFGYTQVMFRLPDNLAPGTCTVRIKAHGQISRAGTFRIMP